MVSGSPLNWQVMRTFGVFMVSAWTNCWIYSQVVVIWDAMVLMWRHCNVGWCVMPVYRISQVVRWSSIGLYWRMSFVLCFLWHQCTLYISPRASASPSKVPLCHTPMMCDGMVGSLTLVTCVGQLEVIQRRCHVSMVSSWPRGLCQSGHTREQELFCVDVGVLKIT